jgi:uracil-DNA glycosylase
MTNTLSTEILQKTDEIILKLQERLKPTGWYHRLVTLLNGPEFKQIIETLVASSYDGKRFTPVIKDLFRAFELTPYNKLRIVFVGQDPYPQIGVANGVAFCNANKPDNKMEASLRYISEAVHRTVYESEEQTVLSNDLSRWCNQGILMLNTALTTEVGQIGVHQPLWKPFTQYVIDTIAHSNSGLIWVFMGKSAQQFADLVPDNAHHKLFVSHPASAAYTKQKQWDCKDMFNQINTILHAMNGDKIVW